MHASLEITADPRIPITADDNNVVFDCNAHIIQNMGEHPATIEGKYTLLPGGNLQFGSTDNVTHVNIKWKVKFITSVTVPNPVYTGPRLEIMDICSRVCECEQCLNVITHINGIANGTR